MDDEENRSDAPVRKNMTPVIALGNLRGSFMASVMGMTRPIPSKEKTAVLCIRKYSRETLIALEY